ncbi:MAG: hypothetical protein QNJ18_03130 [Xenococcaceae cyanobacterium MO_167.B52]|nr:hypothetical protein [Xenococcaceae cyanobacterium MO_167.B52]
MILDYLKTVELNLENYLYVERRFMLPVHGVRRRLGYEVTSLYS